MDKYVALIPARGGSKSIPLKNIKLIAGKPLIFWTIDATLNCDKIKRVYLSTDSSEIKDIASQIKNERFEIIGRSPETATDTASTETVMLEFSKNYVFENIMLIQATSPLLTSDDLSLAIEIYERKNADSLLAVVEQNRFIWREHANGSVTAWNYDPAQRPRRQDFDGYLVENGAFYLTSKQNLDNSKCRISGKIACYKMPEETYFELDDPSDWLIIEQLLINQQKSLHDKGEPLKKIKLLITDVDGVLTDGGMYYSKNGESLKKFNTKDGMGIEILVNNGIVPVILTKEKSDIVLKRAEKLKIKEVHIDVKNKLEKAEEIIKKYNVGFGAVVFIGDDINDIQLLKKVGFSCCPFDAVEEVKNVVSQVCKAKGGEGVVREVVEIVLAINSGIIAV